MGRHAKSLLGLALAALAAGVTPATTWADAPRAPHPEPRVIVDAAATRAEDARAIQAAARRGFWGKAVGCYRPGLASEPDLEVDATFDVDVRGGTLRKASLRRRGGKRGGAAKATPSAEVTACLAKRLVGLPMPEGMRASARIRVRLWPGDPPAR